MVTAPASPRKPRAFRRATRAATASLACLALVGCGTIRLETTPPPAPSANRTEVERQNLALAATQVAQLAQACADDGGAHADVFAQVAKRATEQEAALGGVWVPFATSSPSPHPSVASSGGAKLAAPSTAPGESGPAGATAQSPAASAPTSTTDPSATAAAQSPTTAVPPSSTDPTSAPASEAAGCSPLALATALGESAQQATRIAASESEQNLVILAASISVARYLDVARIGAIDDSPTAPALPAAPITDAGTPRVSDREALARLVRNEDATGYVMEFVAARLPEDRREAMLVASQAHRRAADALATANELAGKDDPRLPVYDVPAAERDPKALSALVAEQLATLPQAYFDVVPATQAGGDRERVLAALLGAQLAVGTPDDALPYLEQDAPSGEKASPSATP